MNVASPLDGPRRGLSVVFVRYDREKYPRAWGEFRTHLRRLAPDAAETVIVDNAAPARTEERLDEGAHVIGGDNSAWEFSAFDTGIEWLRSQGRLRDLTLLATDAFAAYGEDFLALVDPSVLRSCRRHAAAVGWVDSFEESCRLFGSTYDNWLRTSYLILPSEALASVQPFAHPLADDQLFDADWRKRWLPDAPLSSGLRRRIDHWLTGTTGDEALAGADTWHSRLDLDANTFPFFKAKARAILREHHLSIRLRAAEVRTFDMRVLADRLARGKSPAVDTADESLAGLQLLRSREMAREQLEVATSPGHRLIFAGDLQRPADVAAARRFTAHVMPLVLQRFPTATFELLEPDAGLPATMLAGVNNTLVTTPTELARGRSEEVAAIVLPLEAGARVAPVPPLDRPKWESVGAIEIGRAASRHAAAAAQIIAIAGGCCDALMRAASSFSSGLPKNDSGRRAAGEDSGAPADEELLPEVFRTVAHRWRAGYQSWSRKNVAMYEEREAHERSLVLGVAPFVVQGLCRHCGRETSMHVDFEFGGDALAARPNWRERLVCQVCGLNSKMRGLLHVLREVVVPGADPRILVWELEDELTAALSSKFTDVIGVVGDVELPRVVAESRGGGRPAPFDCILAVDMFERAADLEEAIVRSSALLRDGGGMVFSAAFLSDRERSRALDGAKLGEKRQEFGWSMLEAFRDTGFEDVVAHFFWSRTFGYLGREQVVFVARKAARDKNSE